MAEHIVKSFTIIDFLSYMGPGAVFLLALQFFIGGVTAPYTAFFVLGGEVTLAAYFIFVSYLCGNLLHEIGKKIEPWLVKKNMHAAHWETQQVRDAYQKRFYPAGMPLEQNGCEIFLTPEKQIKAGKTIFHYVQRNHRPQRLMFFHAVFLMSRTMFVTASLIIPLSVVDLLMHHENQVCDIVVIVACILCAILFYFRWKEFEQKSVDEAYLLFTTADEK